MKECLHFETLKDFPKYRQEIYVEYSENIYLQPNFINLFAPSADFF